MSILLWCRPLRNGDSFNFDRYMFCSIWIYLQHNQCSTLLLRQLDRVWLHPAVRLYYGVDNWSYRRGSQLLLAKVKNVYGSIGIFTVKLVRLDGWELLKITSRGLQTCVHWPKRVIINQNIHIRTLELRYGIFHFLTKCPPNVNSSRPSSLNKQRIKNLNDGYYRFQVCQQITIETLGEIHAGPFNFMEIEFH